MLPTLWPWVAGSVLMALLVHALRHWARGLPVAYGWDPETHDRQTCAAMELLRAEDAPNGPVTLFGWVLRKLASASANLNEEYAGQIRRGAIEEDMHSHIINEFEFISGVGDGTIAAVAAYVNPWWLAALAAKKAAGYVLENVEWIAGTNGAYHFYNAKKAPSPADDGRAGLSEPTYVGQILSQASRLFGTGSLTPPLESAATRALDPSTSYRWSFDFEDRHYTFEDGVRYFRMGYSALAFYAPGRVLHLLQDMVVPAHVRDDSHLGVGGDASDPLEGLAGAIDWGFVLPTEGADASKTVRWSYRPKRGWTTGTDLVTAAQGHYVGIGKGLAARDHFWQLADWSHGAHYSLGTIPGNPDSHDPNNTTTQPWWRTGAAVDWTKCAPNVEALCAACGLLVDCARAALASHQALMMQYEQQVRGVSSTSPDLSTMRGQVMAEQSYSKGLLEVIERDLTRQLQTMGSSHGSFVRVIEVLCQLARQIAGLSDPNPQYGPMSASPWKHYRLQEFESRAQAMDLDRLRLAARGASSTVEAVKAYIDGFGKDEQRLAKVFDPQMPFILPRDLLVRQYHGTAPRAVARSARLMADWFESLYAPGQGMGVGLWQNANAETGAIPSTYRVETKNEAAATKTYGVANHLPAPIEMTCEFTLVALTDANTGASVSDRKVSIDAVVGHVSPVRFDAAYRLSVPGSQPAAGSLDIRGRYEHSVVIGSREKGAFPFGTAPHGLGLQEEFQWPEKGAWGAGAIRREEEAEKLKATNLTPGQAPAGVARGTRDDFFATFLRLEAHLVAKENDS